MTRRPYSLPSLANAVGELDGCIVLRRGATWTLSRMDVVVFIQTHSGQVIGALCTFLIPRTWLTQQPLVYCHEYWFRRGDADWHSYSDGGLCWELHDRWFHHLSAVKRRLSDHAFSTHAAEYLMNSVRSLLQRHVVGHELALVDWPTEWECWAHGDTALKQYYNLAQ